MTLPRSAGGAIWVTRSTPPLSTSPQKPPVRATAARTSAAEPAGAPATTPKEVRAAPTRPMAMARAGAMRGTMSWLTAPETRTRKPEAPTRA